MVGGSPACCALSKLRWDDSACSPQCCGVSVLLWLMLSICLYFGFLCCVDLCLCYVCLCYLCMCCFYAVAVVDYGCIGCVYAVAVSLCIVVALLAVRADNGGIIEDSD